MRPSGSIVSIDLTATNPGQAKFGVYGTTVHAISPQYNVMAANLQLDITNRYNKCIIEGAKKKERVQLNGICVGIEKSKYDVENSGSGSDDNLYKVFKLDTKWPVVNVIKTFITYARLNSFMVLPVTCGSLIGYTYAFTILFLDVEICTYNKIYRSIKDVKYATAPSIFGTGSVGNPTESKEGVQSPGAVSSSLQSITQASIDYDEAVQGSLGPDNTVRFGRAMFNYWPDGVSVNSLGGTVKTRVSLKNGGINYSYNGLYKRCAALSADVLIETIPLRVEVTVPGTASMLSKTLRIVNTSFRYSEDPDDMVDDTIRMTQYAQDVLQKYKDIKVNGSITLDTIDLTWDLDKTVNLINTAQGSWETINVKVIGIQYDFDSNTTILEITSEYLK